MSGQRRSISGEKQNSVRKRIAKEVTFTQGLKKRNSLREKDTPQRRIQTDENNEIVSRNSKLRATKKWISRKRKKFGFYAKRYDRTL